MERWQRRAILGLLMVLLGGLASSSGLARWFEDNKSRESDAEREQLQAAETALQANNYAEALRLYDSFLTQHPQSEEMALVHEKRGEIYVLQENYRAALTEFQEVVQNYPGRPEALEAGWGVALTAYKMKDFPQAAAAAASLYPRMPAGERRDKVAMLAAECEGRQTRWAEAASWYAKVVREGSDAEIKQNARSQAQNLIEARLSTAELETLIQATPNGFPLEAALKQLALKAYQNGDLDLSQSTLERLLTEFPNSDFAGAARELMDKLARRKKVDSSRIGLILPLSGPRAAAGQKTLQGIALAAEIFGPVKDAYPIELCVRDSGEDPDQAARAVEELVYDEHVIAILGPLLRSAGEAAAAKAAELEVPLIVLAPMEKFSHPDSPVFLDCQTKTAQVRALLDWAMGQKGLTRFATLYPGDAYGQEFADLFANEVALRHGTVVNEVDYVSTETDFTPEMERLLNLSLEQLRKYRNSKNGPPHDFEALFIPDAWNLVAMIAPQLRFHRLTGVQLLGINSWHNEELLRQTKPSDLAGAVFADSFAPELNKPQYNEFDYRFRKSYGEPPALIETQAFEATAVILHLIRDQRVENRTQLVQALRRLKDFPQVLGPITIAPSGEWQKPLVLFTFKSGRLEPLPEKGP